MVYPKPLTRSYQKCVLGDLMKKICFLLIIFCLSGCTYLGTLATGIRRIGTILWDDRPLKQDAEDTQINLALRSAFIKEDIKLGADVEVTVFNGVVLLTGAIPSTDLIMHLVTLTWQTPGVKKVYNYIRQDTPLALADVQEDAAVSGFIRTQLMLTKGIKSSNYKLTMENKVLYIMGQSTSRQEYEKVLAVIKDTAGVEKVVTLIPEILNSTPSADD